MTVLVLGGTGFIGIRAIRRLVDGGQQVVCMDVNTRTTAFAGMEDRVSLVYGDIIQGYGGAKGSRKNPYRHGAWIYPRRNV